MLQGGVEILFIIHASVTLTVSNFRTRNTKCRRNTTGMNESPEIFSTPKLINGEGDGIKNITVRRRVAVPSSRKFNANIPPNESMRIRIGNALSELQGGPKPHSCLKKSQTVAEITPVKSRVRKRPVTKTAGDGAAGAALHATPRPVDEETPAAASSSTAGRCPRERAACVVYQRLLLCVWRRCRERLATLSESCGRQQDQIKRLEMQVDVLKNLRVSESRKRAEALDESQQLRRRLGALERDSEGLNQKLRDTQEELEITEEDLKVTRTDLKKSSEQVAKAQEALKEKREERLELLAKISTQEYEILKQNSLICQLEEQLRMTERNLQNTESSYKAKQEEYSEAIQQLQSEVDVNCSLNEQLISLRESKANLENRTKDLEEQLEEYSQSCEDLIDENLSMRCNLNDVTLELDEAKRRTWLKSAGEIASMSLTVLQKVAYIMLPAYLDRT